MTSLFEWGKRTYVMGIVNVTPDSFSGDGLMAQKEWIQKAVEQGVQQEKDGADMLDVGGESTRPGGEPVSLEEELQRVLPVISALSQQVHIPISIDTYKAEVARQALSAGAQIVNDVWALSRDMEMASVVAQAQVPIILMHNASDRAQVQAGAIGGHYGSITYTDIVADIQKSLQLSVQKARDAGVMRENIILDPGFGFGKTPEQNIELLRRLGEFSKEYPLLIGLSRKSFLSYQQKIPVAERLPVTAAAIALAVQGGADIVRVHDVKEIARVVRFSDQLVQ